VSELNITAANGGQRREEGEKTGGRLRRERRGMMGRPVKM